MVMLESTTDAPPLTDIGMFGLIGHMSSYEFVKSDDACLLCLTFQLMSSLHKPTPSTIPDCTILT